MPRHLRRPLIQSLWLPLLVGPIAASAQQTLRHEIRLRVSDGVSAARWYSEGLGFNVVSVDRFPTGRALAYLELDEARLILEEDSSVEFDGRSGVIKLGLLLPDVAATFARLEASFPESLLQSISDLPSNDVEDWPLSRLLANGPDGILIQGFGDTREVRRARWFLAALSVASLDVATAWYARQAKFEEVGRPDGGDPRQFMKRGTFYLELDESALLDESSNRLGVSQIVLDSRRADSACRWLSTPEHFELRYCGWTRGASRESAF